MKFNYKKLASGILRPIIPIEVGYKNERTKYLVVGSIKQKLDLCPLYQNWGMAYLVNETFLIYLRALNLNLMVQEERLN